MAFLNIPNVKVVGISAGVPKRVINNLNVPYKISEDYENADFVATTGVVERHVSEDLTTSDLCFAAAERLIKDLGWDKKEIDALIIVSQTLDYILPATSCILQDKLGLTKDCYTFDIQLGCSGWVYGMSSIASLMQNGCIKKALLMAGDAAGHFRLPEEKWDALFGYAGTVTALEYCNGAEGIKGQFGTDGSGYDAIIIPDGGSRNPITHDSLTREEEFEGKKYLALESRMKGMDVFSFGINTVPKSIKRLAQQYGYDYLDSDYFLFHQANKKMINMIVKKLKLPLEKVPDGMKYFGNTSSASIPLAIVTELGDALRNGHHTLTCCGFGVGLSWGTLRFSTDDLIVSQLVEVESDEHML